jgi:protoporphyrinogen/coproporphyrinogen III oxidase
MDSKQIAIIGAGITGLTAAYKLQKKGEDVTLFERKGEAGGSIKTVRDGNWQVEYGPNTLLLKDRVVSEFIDELGLSGEKVVANPKASKRFILKDGNLEPVPFSMKSAFSTSLFSSTAKLRVLAEPFIPKSRDRDQTVAEFVERRLGNQVLDYAVNPFVAGIYANRPESLSLRHTFPMMDELEQHYGSLIWGAVAGRKKRMNNGRISRELISFKNGMQELPNAIAEKMNRIRLNHEVSGIEKSESGWMVQTQMGSFGPYSDVIVNTPIYKWDKNFLPIPNSVLEELQKVSYPPLSVMLLGYKKQDISHPLDGFGFLVPEKEGRDVLGALFTSTLFEERAPKDCHLLTVFVGGGRHPELALMDSEQLLNLIEHDLKELIGLKGEVVFKDHVFWPNSIPGYHVGYDHILETFNKIEMNHEGLHLAGNFRGGVSVPDCIKNGLDLAVKVSGPEE